MTRQEIAAIISIARRAPLSNMAEAEGVAMLLQKLAAQFAQSPDDTPAPSSPSGFTSPYGISLE